jgi:hypothetical protein
MKLLGPWSEPLAELRLGMSDELSLHILRGRRIEEFSAIELNQLHDQLCDQLSPEADLPEDQVLLAELDLISEELERRNERL